jgi:iron-sulfur cluster protein
MADSDKLFCSKPVAWFEISRSTEEGQAFLCCPAWLEKPVGNLLRQSVSEVWNSPAAADVRRSILDGSFEYCNTARCPYLQTRSGPGSRHPPSRTLSCGRPSTNS